MTRLQALAEISHGTITLCQYAAITTAAVLGLFAAVLYFLEARRRQNRIGGKSK